MRLGDRLKQADGNEAPTTAPAAPPSDAPRSSTASTRTRGSRAMVSARADGAHRGPPEQRRGEPTSSCSTWPTTRSPTIMNAEDTALSADEKARLVEEISADVIGYGPITPFLDDPDVTEIMANNTDGIWVERRGLLEDTGVTLRRRRVAPPGHRPHRDRPSADASTSRRRWSTPACPTAPASTP